MPGYGLTDYGDILLDHFENPRNVGGAEDLARLPAPPGVAALVAVGRAGNPACGDRLELSLRIAGGRIDQARFRASGCAAAIASSSMTTVLLTGATLEQAASLTDEAVAAALGGLPPAKVHCSVLAGEAVRSALADHRARASRPGDRA